MPDYMPGSDADFNLWQAQFMSYATANTAALGLVAGDLTALTTAQSAWVAGYASHNAAIAAAGAAKVSKDHRRRDYEAMLRALVKRLQASVAVDDGERAALGITIPDPTSSPVPVPTSRPVAIVDTSQRLQHTVRFADEGTPTKKAKPAGVRGVQIWMALRAAGAAGPASATDLTYQATDTSTPYVNEFDGGNAGKTAWYWLRWENARGEPGPWSEPISATVGA